MSGAEPVLIGAALGAGGSLITGGNPLQGALMGAAGGVLGPALGTALGSAAPGAAAGAEAALSSAAPDAVGASMAANSLAGSAGADALAGYGTAASNGLPWATPALNSAAPLSAADNAFMAHTALSPDEAFLGHAQSALGDGALDAASPDSGGLFSNGLFSNLMKGNGLNTGLGLISVLGGLGKNQGMPEMKKDDEKSPKAKPLDRTYTPVNPQSYLTSGGNRSFFNNVNPMVQYYAKGGIASRRMPMKPRGPVMGPGDGQSDQIPAQLSDGEFVISAPVVSALGNGSNSAGARKLNQLQKRVIAKHYKGKMPMKSGGLGHYMGGM